MNVTALTRVTKKRVLRSSTTDHRSVSSRDLRSRSVSSDCASCNQEGKAGCGGGGGGGGRGSSKYGIQQSSSLDAHQRPAKRTRQASHPQRSSARPCLSRDAGDCAESSTGNEADANQGEKEGGNKILVTPPPVSKPSKPPASRTLDSPSLSSHFAVKLTCYEVIPSFFTGSSPSPSTCVSSSSSSSSAASSSCVVSRERCVIPCYKTFGPARSWTAYLRRVSLSRSLDRVIGAVADPERSCHNALGASSSSLNSSSSLSSSSSSLAASPACGFSGGLYDVHYAVYGGEMYEDVRRKEGRSYERQGGGNIQHGMKYFKVQKGLTENMISILNDWLVEL